MSDAFEALRLPLAPVEPDPAFAARLRARIERALTLPRGVAVSTTMPTQTEPTQTEPTQTEPTQTEPTTNEHLGAAIPYLAVTDARRALDWYVDIFGARLIGDPIVMPDGRIGHSELELNGAKIYLADAHPEIGVVAPTPDEAAVSLMLRVPDADAVHADALAAGATSHREPNDDYGSRNAWIVDPFGHRWGLNSPLATTLAPRHGDVVYTSLWVPDADRAAAFYATVLGWSYEQDSGPSRQVIGTSPSQGILGGQEGSTLFVCYAADDLDSAVDRVRAAGGTASEPRDEPYGRTADCTDDQGTRFALNESAGAPAVKESGGGSRESNGTGQGDLGYLTHLVADSKRTRDFYSAVLGWTYRPGGMDDGWEVEDVTPMTGLAGGSDEPAGVPMWRVDDIAAAVARVRRAGGTATEPEEKPYGQLSECSDDQGTRFYLGQL